MSKFDKHYINCNIRCDTGLVGAAACADGNIGPLWEKMKRMAEENKAKIIGWTFWVTLRRGPIEVQAHGDENYAIVHQRAERILLAAEATFEREHVGVADAA
ncbi:hypothetical protein ACRQ5Q_14405 [Bradyrhizobium sp. PMVTL-01]|uniref:hypothetical protein n=1 Tax=Bradyrhizobium sp. PMVTL-01 TaxID=3434999 RepID=UPI003F6EC550